MGKTELCELDWRRKAIRLTLKGLRPCEILQRVPRSRPWLLKWQQRFAALGWPGLEEHSRRPHQAARRYTEQTRAVVLRVRRSLATRAIGLIGPRQVRRELLRQRLVPRVPSLTTIKRWLKQAGLAGAPPSAASPPFYPWPCFGPGFRLHAMDWTARYLEGGAKVFAFHTLDLATRALAQTICTDKSRPSVHAHALEVWQTLGLPDGLQLDNDSAFMGGERTPRRFGAFVRLCLYLGIELIFVPPGEPKRNGVVESLNGLWARGFFERDHFRSVAEVKRKSRGFVTWYQQRYAPPALSDLTPAEAQAGAGCRRLTAEQIHALPEALPITAGRVHFIRQVTAEGEIRLLGERWRVSRSLAQQYVWATVVTHRRRLEISHRRSERASTRLLKVYVYEIPEPIRRLRPEYKR